MPYNLETAKHTTADIRFKFALFYNKFAKMDFKDQCK